MHDGHSVIVGAGISGLACARTLSDAGEHLRSSARTSADASSNQQMERCHSAPSMSEPITNTSIGS